jgi:hypothetical protein
MITNVISSTVRLSLVPARLAGSIAASVVREIRGHGTGRSTSPRSPAETGAGRRAKTATRSRGQARRGRAGTSSRARTRTSSPAKTATKSRAKTGTNSRAKAKSKRQAMPKHTADPKPKTQPKPDSQPQPAVGATPPAGFGRAASPATHEEQAQHSSARPAPLDDAAVAAKLKSALQRAPDLDTDNLEVTVADGVVQLRGEVRSQDVIDRLVARTREVSDVGQVESLLRVRPTPVTIGADTPESRQGVLDRGASLEGRAGLISGSSEEPPPAASTSPGPRQGAALDDERFPGPSATPGGAAPSRAQSEDGDPAGDQETENTARLEKDGNSRPSPADPDRPDDG